MNDERIAPGPEHRRILEVREVRLECGNEECRGEVVSDGFTFLTNPPSYRNRCQLCGRLYDLSQAYPYKEYVPV